jgi:hypothetical protein
MSSRKTERRPSALDAPIPPVLHDDQVLRISQWSKLNNFSRRTAGRILASGRGPKTTQLSTRRVGITVRANREWHQANERA